jgi:hypothetical protein
MRTYITLAGLMVVVIASVGFTQVPPEKGSPASEVCCSSTHRNRRT